MNDSTKKWVDKSNQLNFLNDLSSKLNIKSQEDWYKVNYQVGPFSNVKIHNFSQTLNQHGGRGILYHYDNSFIKMLKSLMPHHNWCDWKFSHVPRNYWKDLENVKTFMNWIKTELNIKDSEDWYKITAVVSLFYYSIIFLY